MAVFPIARRFEKRATELLEEAEPGGSPSTALSRGRSTPRGSATSWYCSASFIDSGAKIAFIGANPGGEPQSQEDDKQLGLLRLADSIAGSYEHHSQ